MHPTAARWIPPRFLPPHASRVPTANPKFLSLQLQIKSRSLVLNKLLHQWFLTLQHPLLITNNLITSKNPEMAIIVLTHKAQKLQ